MLLSPLLRIGRGVTAIIGGGGKTTLLYTLAEELRAKGRVILCTSTHIRVPEGIPLVTGGEDELCAALERHRVLCAGTPSEGGKLTAPPLSFEALATLGDYVLVEADGARGLPLKAHAAHEPVIPPNAQRVVLVVGADGFYRPVAQVCHRGRGNDPATPEWVARHIAAEGFGDRVYINKVESAESYAAAEELAGRLTCPVTAGSLHKGVFTCLR